MYFLIIEADRMIVSWDCEWGKQEETDQTVWSFDYKSVFQVSDMLKGHYSWQHCILY